MNKLTPGSNMRWESSRMMLPEHVQALRQHDIDRMKIGRPDLDEDELQEIQRSLQTVIKTHEFVELSYYKDGFIKQKICTIAKLDPYEKIVQVNDGFGMSYKFTFADVMDIHVVVQDGE
ncbi:YolD-like family protein [Sporolactobacillus pectinivorans]|uniref:YolD-like family protein n=1 Tax=Sporolactobacillus pectinivorans TaxID=1591408 RepID=UPI000C25BA76|nr:YolD-like family protein [Sporolactobacillus pectinivorans]